MAPNFSPSLFKEATTGPGSLGSTEGVEPGGRGAYVTQHAQEASRWEKRRQREMTEKKERKRTRSLHLKGVFSFQTRALALWERQGERKSTGAQAKCEGAAKPDTSFIRIGGWGNVLKSLRPTSNKPFLFSNKITRLATKSETRGLEAEVSL